MTTQIGEYFAGSGPNAAHVNTVLGEVGGPVETSWVTALATPRQGHAAFVASVAPGVAVRPFTLFVNKAPIESERHGVLTWGAAHAGVAGGVMDAVAEGIIAEPDAATLLLVAAVWVNPEAHDEQAVYANNREATLGALRNGRHGRPDVADALAARHTPSNAFFGATVSDVAPIRLDQVNLVVTDVPAARAFYARLGVAFGPACDPVWDEHHVSSRHDERVPLDIDLDSVSFARRWNEGWPGGPGAVLGFKVESRDEVDALVATLAAEGVTVQQPPCDAFWGARYAVVTDPDGNAVGIMSPVDPARRMPAPDPQ